MKISNQYVLHLELIQYCKPGTCQLKINKKIQKLTKKYFQNVLNGIMAYSKVVMILFINHKDHPRASLRKQKVNPYVWAKKSAKKWYETRILFSAFLCFLICICFTFNVDYKRASLPLPSRLEYHCVYFFLAVANWIQPLDLILPIPDCQSEHCL